MQVDPKMGRLRASFIAGISSLTPRLMPLLQRPYPFLMEKLVFGYLTHNGFCETAAVTARDALAGTVHVSAVDSEGVQRRQEVPIR